MNSWDLRQFRNDLSKFIEIIHEKGVTGDFSELSNLLVSIDTKSLVEYKFENLCFYINGRIAGTIPNDLNYCQIYLDNMLMVKNDLQINVDPLYCYSMDINIEVYKSRSSTSKSHCSSWHLDRHYNTENVKYTHPTYHFQFGGKKMELIDDGMSVLSCPRIPHPPMDLFLGFHFIISNFFSKKQFTFVKELLDDYDYQEIIKRAQDRLWSPYFQAYDPAGQHNDFTRNNVFPLYIH